MSTNEQTPLSQPASVVRNTLGKEQASQDLVRPISDEALREYCDKNYHQILPTIAEMVHQEKVWQEKLKAVKARLNFKDTSRHSESGKPSIRRSLKERLGPRHARSMSGSPEPRRGRSKSPREKDPERRTVFKRLEKGESIDSNDDLRKAFLENYLQQKSASKNRLKSTTSSKEMGNPQKYSCGEGKSRPLIVNLRSHFRHGNSKKPDKSKTSRRKTSETNKGRSGSRIVYAPKKANRGNAKGRKAVTFNKGIKVKQWKRSGKGSKKGGNLREGQVDGDINGEEDGTEDPMIIEAKRGGHCVHRMYVDGGSSSKILYEHCFNRFRPEVRNQMIPATTPLVGFSGEIIWPLGQISLLVKIGDEEHSTFAWMKFMVVRSPSPYNRIIGRPGVRKIRAVPSTAHEILKFLVAGGTVTLWSNMIIPLECTIVSEPGVPQPVINQVTEEKIQVAIHPEYPK
ncbi:hypothetical protein Tco_0790571 [Tanacetum coccineum]